MGAMAWHVEPRGDVSKTIRGAVQLEVRVLQRPMSSQCRCALDVAGMGAKDVGVKK